MASSRPTILKQSSSKKGSIKWDEDNLQVNEAIKAELPPVKITEPKTPYHAPLQGDDEGMEPLSLDGHAHVEGETEEQRHARFEAMRKAHYRKEAMSEARRMAEEELRRAEEEEEAAAAAQQ
mmetsp:Transcript_4018/g.9997  ORF Transcript_4018/g.9997 Transcript_4018/m.9997 type:complete len:122 (-) Transcript_4018:341-706(-)|eukprot:CAMPEP_0202867020 /NCGR_PEP_ID=MMETSP1391-20130828/8495_1 /ASSEMBLY_ACC=CAM_ASM_000867 /TAXON_ID=1034604 /ORGANISM="Chlamydomonas leiostraca, Strain SAG 11-49" /LENGTH=121 /DNA_ID=CAMNT_0049547017 /DNA_START=153 /DNA_END=518 /DNA_ORIENTATION=-